MNVPIGEDNETFSPKGSGCVEQIHARRVMGHALLVG